MLNELYPILNYEILNNTLYDFILALGAFLVTWLFFRLIQKGLLSIAVKRAEKTKTEIDDAIFAIIKSIKPPFYTWVAFYVSLNFLLIDGWFKKIVDAVIVIWLVYQVVVAIQALIGYIAGRIIKRETDASSKTAIEMASMVAKVILWTIGVLFVLSNLGVDITSLVAGLGIGGIAVALAAQNILGDLFGSFVIFFDKPFVKGDFIKVGEDSGTVKKIGIKTTRLKSMQGEEIIISNKTLTSSKINNFKRMRKRRVDFKIGVIYSTSSKKLKQIPKLLTEIVNSVELAECQRAVFREFADSALVFDIVYDIDSREFSNYMEVQQAINFKIKEAFDELEIEMAYPTQTVFVKK